MSKVTRTSNDASTTKGTLRDIQTSRSAIERVPIEIMDQIFEEYIEMDQSPCNLTFVSRTWRLLALANPWLWRYVLVAEKSGSVPFQEWHLIGVSAAIWTQGKAQVCRGNEDFMAAVERSGSIPIHIIYKSEQERNCSIILKQVLTLPISSRVAVLNINNWWYDIRPIMAQITLGPFTRLSQFRVTALQTIQHEEFVRTVQHSAPLLKTLQFNTLTDSYLTLPILKNLHALKFYEISVERQAFHAVLNSCHQLVELSTPQRSWFDMSTRLGPGALANLEIAEFVCDLRALSTLELINLRSLTVKQIYGYENLSGWQRIHLPKLATLHIRRLGHSVEVFKHLDTPLLQDLHITFEPLFRIPNTELFEVFSSLSFPRLTHLYMKACWGERVFSSIMNGIPNVRKINFIYDGCRDQFAWPSVLDKLARQPICPKLESFMIANEDHPAALPRLQLNFLVKEIQTYRKEHAMPKPRFEVYHREYRCRKN